MSITLLALLAGLLSGCAAGTSRHPPALRQVSTSANIESPASSRPHTATPHTTLPDTPLPNAILSDATAEIVLAVPYGFSVVPPEHVFSDDPSANRIFEFHVHDVGQAPHHDATLFERVISDHRNYYSTRNMGFLATGFAGGAILANTSIDQDIHDHFQTSVHDATSDEWYEGLHAPKELGNGLYTLPVFAAAWGVGTLFDDTEFGSRTGDWGERSLRAFLVGAPPTMLMQKVTGAGRPEEGASHWQFWEDNNGVSGHAFMGSLPFLTAAQVTEEPIPKVLFYAASAAVPLSRVNDGDHYASQALLGWWMAWAASMAVDATQDDDQTWRTVPLFVPGYSGMGLECRW